MRASAQTEAVLLLSASLGKGQAESKPLSATELHRVTQWLAARGRSPADLVTEPDTRGILRGFEDAAISPARILGLLARGGALGLQMERWQRAHLWVMTRLDSDYPSRLLQRLQSSAPPVLFGSGDRRLLGSGGVAIVGSRDASAEDLECARSIARAAAGKGISVISGGARGVDEAAVGSALEAGGTAFAFVADSLLRAAMSAKYRPALMDGRLVLASPYNPDAGFDVGNAMGRNRLIYCAADTALVAACAHESGGTWAGAVEALKHRWVPVWTTRSSSRDPAKAALVERGARWLRDDFTWLLPIIDESPIRIGESMNGAEVKPALSDQAAKASPSSHDLSLYELFLAKLAALAGGEPIGKARLLEKLELTRSQLEAWLKRAVAEKRLHKLTRPLRYSAVARGQRELPL